MQHLLSQAEEHPFGPPPTRVQSPFQTAATMISYRTSRHLNDSTWFFPSPDPFMEFTPLPASDGNDNSCNIGEPLDHRFYSFLSGAKKDEIFGTWMQPFHLICHSIAI